jgi:hypothetical protein
VSALDQERTLRHPRAMSALPPIADIEPRSPNVRLGPEADIGKVSNQSLWCLICIKLTEQTPCFTFRAGQIGEKQ